MIAPVACSLDDAASALGVSRRHVQRLVNLAELDSLMTLSGGARRTP